MTQESLCKDKRRPRPVTFTPDEAAQIRQDTGLEPDTLRIRDVSALEFAEMAEWLQMSAKQDAQAQIRTQMQVVAAAFVVERSSGGYAYPWDKNKPGEPDQMGDFTKATMDALWDRVAKDIFGLEEKSDAEDPTGDSSTGSA